MNKLIEHIVNRINCRLGRIGLPLATVKFYPAQKTDAVLTYFGQAQNIELKNNLTVTQLPQLEKYLGNKTILFSEYISPVLAECLQKSNIEYADLAGNMFLRNGKNCVLIENCAKPRTLEDKLAKGRAMTPAGLKILFVFFTQPEAPNWTFRKISQYAGVSLGSVKYVMTDLFDRKWLAGAQGQLCLQNIRNIYERWTNAYIEKIYNKYDLVRFNGELDWNDKQITEKYPVAFSGETAAARMNLIIPARICLYQWGNINELIARKRWIPDDNGNIEIRQAFWPSITEFKPVVPPLLIYADLIAENDGRCLEVAQTVYERYLAKELS